MGDVNLIFGGGRFGCVAARHLLRQSKPFIVVDENESCLAAKHLPLKKISPSEVIHTELQGGYFLKGNEKLALHLIEKLEPRLVFPTAPIHVVASLVAEKCGMLEWREALESLASRIPPSVIVSKEKATLVTSYNKGAVCKPKCTAPEVCPVTGLKKPCTMYELLKSAVPEGIILRSYQLEPGLGALRGDELLETLKTCERNDRVIIGTACECHGVITALRKI
ncbi:MAG: hypothetical protein QXX87_05080 [Candidatus Jordarchaeales archaeon]